MDKAGKQHGAPTDRRQYSPTLLSSLIFAHPVLINALSLLLSVIVPLIVLLLFPLQLGNNPEKGFETDGTPYSGPRLAWTILQPSLLQGSRVRIMSTTGNHHPIGLSKRTRRKKSWTDDLFASFGLDACYDAPIPTMSFLSQFILTVPSLEHLFTKELLLKMCQIQEQIGPELDAFDQLSPHRAIWSVASYVTCLTPTNRVNCSMITDQDVLLFRQLFDRCLSHRHSILACRRQCQQRHNQWTAGEDSDDGDDDAECVNPTECATIPSECDSQMWFDLFYRILPDNLSLRPLPVNAFLPFYSFAAYHLQGLAVPLKAFTDIESKLRLATENSGDLQLKGLSLEIKRDILLEAAIRDSRFSLMAALAVFLLLTLYSLSFTFALIVLLQLVASVLCALAIYRIFSTELPLLNLIAFVLLISVGSDGAFLLLDTFPVAEQLRLDSLHKCLRHTVKTMFLTQFSTIVPFLLNMLSSVFAFRSFGLFAGLTLVFNYLLLISFLPAFLVIQQRHLNPVLIRWWPSRWWYCFPSSVSQPSLTVIPSPGQLNDQTPAMAPSQPIRLPVRVPSTRMERSRQFLRTLIDDVLPLVLIQGRFVWLCSLTIALFVSAYVCLSELSLPRYNPLQLFRASNPHEYFDQTAEQLFPFVADKIAALPFAVRLTWGIRPSGARSHFDPNSVPNASQHNLNFQLRTPGHVRALAQQLEQMRALPFVEHKAKFWPERFVEWSVRLACPPPHDSHLAESALCCNIQNAKFVTGDQLDRCIRHSTSVLPTNYNDTLIWDNQTHELVGYTALLPTLLHYSHRFSNLSDSFALFDKWLSIGGQVSFLPGWYTTEWAVMSQWFDLQRAIIADCQQSVTVSFLVVFVFSAFILRLKAFIATFTIFCIVLTTVGILVFLGWEIGVLEGVIIVLVVGLSFDYTLHYGALIPSSGCARHRIQRAVRGATRPVAMAALSSILAGGVMLCSETHAFFQVAVFLVVCSSTSLVFAIFFFLPLLYLFMPSSAVAKCEHCVDRQRTAHKMRRITRKTAEEN